MIRLPQVAGRQWTPASIVTATLTILAVSAASVAAYRFAAPDAPQGWVAPTGFSLVNTIELPDGQERRLWIEGSVGQSCWALEVINSDHKQMGAFEACGGSSTEDVTVYRIYSTLVGTVSDDKARTVVLRTPSGASSEPVMLHSGFFTLPDDLVKENENIVYLDVFDLNGIALRRGISTKIPS